MSILNLIVADVKWKSNR